MSDPIDSSSRRSRARGFRIFGWLAVASLLALALLGPSAGGAAAATGAIWTTSITCTTPALQDQNHYAIGEHVHIRGKDFDAGQQLHYTVTGNPGNSSADPGIVVAEGDITANASGEFCVDAYTVAADDDGEYTVDVPPAKNDNYRVNGAPPTNPPPTNPPPTNPPPTVPAPTATPAGSVEVATGTPGRTPPNTATDIGSTGSSSDGWRIPALGLGLLIGTILLLTPSRIVRRRR
jgi:hypothetical protein